MPNYCMVFFESPRCDIQRAFQSLVAYGLTVNRGDNMLICHRENSPKFRVLLSDEEHVQLEAQEIGKSTSLAHEMSKCDARFEIYFDDLNDVLGEINTLMEVQGALQDTSQGYLFTPWNGNLAEPWQDS